MTAYAGLTQDALYSCSHMATVGVKGFLNQEYIAKHNNCVYEMPH